MSKLFDFVITLLSSIFHHLCCLSTFSTISSLRPWCGLDSSRTWSLQLVTNSFNFIIVGGAKGASEGAFDIMEAHCAGRKKQRGSWDGGAASKDSSADVSKQDGCQVSLVNYLCNKNRLVFMRHAWVHALLCGFFTQRAVDFFFLMFELTLSFLNQSEAFYHLITQREVKRWIFVLRGQWISDCPLLSFFRQRKRELKRMPMALLFSLYGSCHPLFQGRKQQGIIICVWYVMGLKAWQA